jgi:hypothetical protein
MKNILSASLVLLIISLSTDVTYGQNIGINADGSMPNANAMLDIKSSNKGLLIPRMDSISRKAIPATKGLMVYDTTTNSFWFSNGNNWASIPVVVSGPVAFNVIGSGNRQSIATNTSAVVDFGDVGIGLGTFNDSSYFNAATDAFTAPSSGYYHFDASVTIFTDPNYEPSQVIIFFSVNGDGNFNNGKTIYDFPSDPYNYSTCDINMTVKLNQNDNVKLVVYSGSNGVQIGGSSYADNRWSGFRLY